MIRIVSAVASDRLTPRLRQGIGAVVVAALLAGAAPRAAAQEAGQWILRADGLELSDRSLFYALGVKKKTGEKRDREQEAREHLERLKSRLLLAAAAVRREYADDFAVTGPLAEFRVRHLVDQLLAEKVDVPARKLAGDDKSRFRTERDRLFREQSRKAAAAFPATIDEKALAAAVQGAPGDLVVARVAGDGISAEEVRRGMQRLDHPGQKKETPERIARTVLQTFIDHRSLAALAEREGLAERGDFRDETTDQRIRLLADRYAEIEVYPSVVVAPSDVEARYGRETQRLRRGEEREIFEILVPDEEKAKAIAARLAAGGSFADEVRANSIGSSKEAGGRLGYLRDKQTIPQLDAVIRSLREGEVSAPVRTPFGWHILRCARVVSGRVPPLTEVRAALEAEELAERRAAAVLERVARLEREIKVEVNEQRFQQIVKGQVR